MHVKCILVNVHCVTYCIDVCVWCCTAGGKPGYILSVCGVAQLGGSLVTFCLCVVSHSWGEAWLHFVCVWCLTAEGKPGYILSVCGVTQLGGSLVTFCLCVVLHSWGKPGYILSCV